SLQLLFQWTPGLAREQNFNLRSNKAQFDAGQNGKFTSVEIVQGGVKRTITPADNLTAAEYLAVQQVLSGAGQSLVLNGQGRAVGGSFKFSADLGPVNKFVVPHGVTGFMDAASLPSLDISGNLRNSGNIFAYSSNSSIGSASINADNIYNHNGAMITSTLPAANILQLAGATNRLDLALSALHDIVNWGTISSSGNLSLTAGNSIT